MEYLVPHVNPLLAVVAGVALGGFVVARNRRKRSLSPSVAHMTAVLLAAATLLGGAVSYSTSMVEADAVNRATLASVLMDRYELPMPRGVVVVRPGMRAKGVSLDLNPPQVNCTVTYGSSPTHARVTCAGHEIPTRSGWSPAAAATLGR